MEEYKAAYLECERICSQMGDEFLQFRNSKGDVITGFFKREKIRERENLENDAIRERMRKVNLEIDVLAEEGNKVTVQLPHYHCHIFIGGKRHEVNKD